MPPAGGLLTLDLSLTTGWAYGLLGARPVFGSWFLGKMANAGRAYAVLEDNVDDAIKLFQPRAVVYEAPLPANRQNQNDVARLLLGLCAVTELICARHALLCCEQNCGQARSKVLGKRPTGGAEVIKPIIMDWAKRRGWDIKGQDDEADALLLLQYATVAMDRSGKAHFFKHGELL